MSADGITESQRREIEQITTVFDRLYLLHEAAACAVDSMIPRSFQHELDALNESLERASDLTFTFSGHGFIPAIMPDGETDTIFTKVENLNGTLPVIDLFDGDDVECVVPEDMDDYTEDDGDMMAEPLLVETMRSRLELPPSGLLPYLEFLLQTEQEEQPIGGIAMRAEVLKAYAIMDVGTLVISSIEPTPELIDPEEMQDIIIQEAENFRRLTRSTTFRRSSHKRQAQMVEQHLERLNRRLQLDKYRAGIQPEEIYIPEITEEGLSMRRRIPYEFITSFNVHTLRLDSLENFALSTGKRIVRDASMLDPDAGLCLVAEINGNIQEVLETESRIIWIPIKFPKRPVREKKHPRRSTTFAAEFREAGIIF